MKVKLIEYMPNLRTIEMNEQFLNAIASQSRKKIPVSVDGLFEKTKEWGHDSIQEFATYIFHLENVSVNLLKQLTRHRIASYNVMSHRHVTPSKVILPKGIKGMKGKIFLDNGSVVQWNVDDEGNFYPQYRCIESWSLKSLNKCPIPLEDIRYGYPCGLSTNLFLQFNGRSLRNFLRLRTDSHAQWEIREVANEVKRLVREVHPFMVNDFD